MKEEITDMDLEVIAEQIKEGCTSGIFSDGEKRISWEIKINKF
jgi:hypothetical protein